MNLRLLKKVVTIGAVLLITLSPILAGGHYGYGNGYGNGYGCGSGYSSYSGYGRSNAQFAGTIQSIDSSADTITVANADGALTVVHINPTTNLLNMTDFPQIWNNGYNYMSDINTMGMTDAQIRSAYATARAEADAEWAQELESRIIDFNDLKSGDWVEVSIIPSGTLTREANGISVYR